MNILIVEDDAETANYISRGLREHGWTVTWHSAPQEAMLSLVTNQYDAIILDRMLPGMDGIDALRLMRAANVMSPILMLTALSGLEDRVEGLEAGADDYLSKPFALSELIARLKSLARRPAMAVEISKLDLGDLHLDRIARRATRGADELELSPLEFRLLDFLVQHAGEVVTRSMLLEKVWGYRFDPKTSLVQTHMSRLRAKVDKPYDFEMIKTIRGAGYAINAP